MLEAGDTAVDHTKIAVKFAVGLVILVLVMANARKPRIPDGLYYGLIALTVADVAVALFWSPVHGEARPGLSHPGRSRCRAPGLDGSLLRAR